MADFEEIECKFLDIDVQTVVAKLQELGAEKQFSELFRRAVFDFPDWRLDKDHSWLRVRDEGHRTTVSYKKRLEVKDGQNDQGMKEIEFTTNDFDSSCELFRSIGMIDKFYEENRRTQYILNGVEICIDEWPMIPVYVEVEGHDWDSVHSVADALGFDWEARKICSTMQVYREYDIDEKEYQTITFDKQIKR